MKEAIERLREARGQVLATIETSGKSDAETLRHVAQDIHLSIIELERLDAAAEVFRSAITKALDVKVKARKTCTCGVVNVTSGLRGYGEYVPGLTDPQCPIHGNSGVVIANV